MISESPGIHPQAKKSKYLTAPIASSRMPPGVPYIVGNEAAERFSFYGMRAILVVFMMSYLMNGQGQPDHMDEAQAREWFHLFVASAYFFPLFGALIADVFLGKYLTIMSLSIIYCLGHLTLALNDTRFGLALGLGLIALGAGGIKPCVSSNVGDQFGASNQHLLPKVFSWFYFAINLGSMVSILLIPIILKNYGPHWAFGTPGLLMLLATWVFWLGRKKFVHVPPGGMGSFREAFSREGLKSIGSLIVIYLFIAVFWSLYDQSSSAWVQQAGKMNLNFLGREWLPAQIQALNPILILIYIPLFTYVIYPVINKIFPLTPLRKISIGFFLAALSFLVPAWLETLIQAGAKPTIAWHVLAYSLLMAAEIFISITGLEFSYTQSPKRMKSLVMSFFMASVFVGNLFTSAVNLFIQNPDKTVKLSGAAYYLFFAILMFLAAIAFIFVAMRYRVRTYIQDETPAAAEGLS